MYSNARYIESTQKYFLNAEWERSKLTKNEMNEI